MEELFKALGGLPGIFGLLVGCAGLFWRFKVPAIGLEYIQRELERHRGELIQSDKDRAALRDEVKSIRSELAGLEKNHMDCLTDREKCRRHIRQLERQVRGAGGQPVIGEEERN